MVGQSISKSGGLTLESFSWLGWKVAEEKCGLGKRISRDITQNGERQLDRKCWRDSNVSHSIHEVNMRDLSSLFVAICVSLVFFANHATPGDRDEALAVIDRAIKAGGGGEKIGKFRAVSFKATAKLADDGVDEVNYMGVFQDAEHVRVVIGANFQDIVVVNGGKAWMKIHGKKQATQLSAEEGGELAKFFHAVAMPDLLGVLKQKPYTLTAPTEEKINDKPAVGLRVTHEKHEEVLLFFEKKTGLPIKTTVSINSGTDAKRTYEFFFRDYREFQGVKHFTTIEMHFDGKKQGEYHISELKLLEKVEAGTFDRPQ